MKAALLTKGEIRALGNSHLMERLVDRQGNNILSIFTSGHCYTHSAIESRGIVFDIRGDLAIGEDYDEVKISRWSFFGIPVT